MIETKPLRSAFDRDALRAADAVFEPKKPEPPFLDASPPSMPRGRILPSLVVDNPPELADEAASAAEAVEPPLPPVPKSRARLSKPRRVMSAPTVEAEDAAQAAFNEKADETTVVHAEPPAASSPAVANVAVSAKRAKVKPRIAKPVVRESARPAPPPADRQTKIVAPPPPPSSAPSDIPKPVRKRTIMGRYVFGDELKPGERWKRLLRRTR